MLKFYIRLSDISVSSIGKTFLKIGFSPSSIYSGTNEDGFEWGIRRSSDGEWIELLNPNNSVSARVKCCNKCTPCSQLRNTFRQ